MKFRKKPVVIEAWRWNPMTTQDLIPNKWPEWVRNAYNRVNIANGMVIVTLEGAMTASPGDWIILGVKGEVYPCKPDIFEATYEPAEGV